MSAHYDTYDYPSYWEGRDYENECEDTAIAEFLKKIPKIDSVIDIGAGFGRLYRSYNYRARKIYLSDPSSKLLSIAQKNIKDKNVKFIHSTVENLSDKLSPKSFNLVILVRVIHHLKDIDKSFQTINKLLKPGGYLILEFANKAHFKAWVREFFKGNFTYVMDIFPKDIRKKSNVRKGTIPFINNHPGVIVHMLHLNGFKVIETRSVSNIRSEFLKKVLPKDFMCTIERFLQKPLSYINFGPSIFILAKKED